MVYYVNNIIFNLKGFIMADNGLARFLVLADSLGWSSLSPLKEELSKSLGVEYKPSIPKHNVSIIDRLKALHWGETLFPQMDWTFARKEVYKNALIGKEAAWSAPDKHVRYKANVLPNNIEGVNRALEGVKDLENDLVKSQEEVNLKMYQINIIKDVLIHQIEDIAKTKTDFPENSKNEHLDI